MIQELKNSANEILEFPKSILAGICPVAGAGAAPMRPAGPNPAAPGAGPPPKADCTASFTIASMFPWPTVSYTIHTLKVISSDAFIPVTCL